MTDDLERLANGVLWPGFFPRTGWSLVANLSTKKRCRSSGRSARIASSLSISRSSVSSPT